MSCSGGTSGAPGLVALGFPSKQFRQQVRRAEPGWERDPGQERRRAPRLRAPWAWRGGPPARFPPALVPPGVQVHPGVLQERQQFSDSWANSQVCGQKASSPVTVPGPSCSSLPQENAKNEEILKGLRYVRPDGGFEPGLRLRAKGEGNGAQAHPLFASARRCARPVSTPLPS
ncbi:hypothetical protein J1605_007073 [Eschrichtius robustus]|uniref:Uncharacterized protein n=1 Tax=Eschrichtius robustus TaxID=9764 RepID=A0AB34H1D2_ESCRO|nr:hypothetical protein J1605_007073 [Eschrichtius robustus]